MNMNTRNGTLHEQVALVTGGSSGIGAAVAKELAAAGARVAVNFAHSRDQAEIVVDEIERAGGTACAVEADVSQEAAVREMFDRVIERYGRLHLLVNNAGVQKDAPIVDMTLEDWNTVIGVNLTGQFLCARRAAQIFIEQGCDEAVSRSAGRIICMSSVHEIIPWECRVNYAASKGGVMQLTRTLAQELARHRIRVNGVAPGAIKTPINRSAWESADAEQALLKRIPYGRIGEPDDVARAVRWLASDESDYVHGATLYIDGGMTLYPAFWNSE
jgi:glucose 1-dehydrogenase